jgi:hypothetical protein
MAILDNAHPVVSKLVGVVDKKGRGRKRFRARFVRKQSSTPLYRILDTPLSSPRKAPSRSWILSQLYYRLHHNFIIGYNYLITHRTVNCYWGHNERLSQWVGECFQTKFYEEFSVWLVNARRMRTSVTVLSLCVCVSTVYKTLKSVVLQFEHICTEPRPHSFSMLHAEKREDLVSKVTCVTYHVERPPTSEWDAAKVIEILRAIVSNDREIPSKCLLSNVARSF